MSCTLKLVVCVIHTLRNFYSKPNQNFVWEFCKLFWVCCYVFLPVVMLLNKRQSEITKVAIYSQIKSRNCQDLVKIQSFITDILKSRLSRFFIIVHSPKGLENSKLFFPQQEPSCSESAPSSQGNNLWNIFLTLLCYL